MASSSSDAKIAICDWVRVETVPAGRSEVSRARPLESGGSFDGRQSAVRSRLGPGRARLRRDVDRADEAKLECTRRARLGPAEVGRFGNPGRTRYGCFLPDLTGLARRPSATSLPRHYTS